MSTYAVIENGIVINVIVAESKEIAEQVSEKECVEQTHENPLSVDWYWNEQYSKYIPPSIFSSWIYDGENWTAPTPMPVEEGKFFTWDDNTASWVSNDMPSEDELFLDEEAQDTDPIGEAPFSQWTWTGTQWNPPFPKPDDNHDYVWSESESNWKIK